MQSIMTMGEILVEIMAERKGQSFRAPGPLAGPYASGAPAIFIDQVSRLGHPAAIIGCPVGFVGAMESKQALMQDLPVPCMAVHGRLGGSAITVAAINALASHVE